MSNEWISAAEALRLAQQVMSFHQAPRAICTRAHAGLIATRAIKLIVDGRAREETDVPKNFWWAGGESALTQNWTSGDFETWIDNRHHIQAFGVAFERNGIESMIGPRAAPVPEAATSGTGGGRPPAAWWDDLWIDLCRQLWTGALNPDRQSDVEKAMLDWAAAHGHEPAISTIRPRARKLWNALRAEDEN